MSGSCRPPWGGRGAPDRVLCAIRCYVQTCESSASRAAAAAAGVTAQAGRGRASAISLKREEAEQADGPSRGQKGAPQELGCLPDLTAQNNNEKTGQRIHNFEKIVKIKARGSAVYLVLAQFNGRLCGAREWMSLQMKLQSEEQANLSESVADEERMITANSRSNSPRQSPTRASSRETSPHLKTYSPSATAARPPASWGRKAPCAPRARTTRSRRRASTVPRRRHILNGPRAHRPCTSPHQTI